MFPSPEPSLPSNPPRCNPSTSYFNTTPTTSDCYIRIITSSFLYIGVGSRAKREENKTILLLCKTSFVCSSLVLFHIIFISCRRYNSLLRFHSACCTVSVLFFNFLNNSDVLSHHVITYTVKH